MRFYKQIAYKRAKNANKRISAYCIIKHNILHCCFLAKRRTPLHVPRADRRKGSLSCSRPGMGAWVCPACATVQTWSLDIE